MARARTGTKKKRPKKKRTKKKRSAKGASKTRAKRAKKRPKAKARRRRAPRVKQRIGPVQLWLPLQMPLGLLGGVAVAPAPAPGIDDPPAAPTGAPGEQESLFD